MSDPLAEELALLTEEYSRSKPLNLLQFCADYFNAKLSAASNPSANPRFKSPFDSNDPQSASKSSQTPHFKLSFPDDAAKDSLLLHPIAFNANRRTSVSAEALNPDKFDSDHWTPPTNNLTPQQRLDLAVVLSSNFLFQQLDPSLKKTVLSALQKKSFEKDLDIIVQGDVGDYFYIIELGSVQFIVNGSPLHTAGPLSSFGELALMYNSPRAATVHALEDVTCWLLDRSTFRRILLEGTFKRRIMYEDFLKDVEILSSLTAQERSKIADALSPEKYQKGDRIVTEGEQGENFYFIELGNCEVKTKAGGHIKVLHKGDYFGEIALLNDLPRQATVEAMDDVVVATLGKSGFQRLLGPAVDVLKKRDPSKSL